MIKNIAVASALIFGVVFAPVMAQAATHHRHHHRHYRHYRHAIPKMTAPASNAPAH